MVYYDVRIQLRNLFQLTKSTLEKERTVKLDAVKLIGKLHASNPWVNLGMNERQFLTELGMSRDCYYSRVRSARALHQFPEIEAAFLNGEIALSTLGRIQAKLTQANIGIVLENIRGRTKRDAMLFMSKVTNDGRVLKVAGSIELTIKVSEDELAAFDRLRDVLSARGSNPSSSEVLCQAVEDALEKRDPIRKAKRAEARSQKKIKQPVLVVPGQQGRQSQRKVIPANVRHQVWLRDGGQCTHRFFDGNRCEETAHLELDHIQMRCRDGGDDVSNIRLVCRRHNQYYAERALGAGFMRSKRELLETT